MKNKHDAYSHADRYFEFSLKVFVMRESVYGAVGIMQLGANNSLKIEML